MRIHLLSDLHLEVSPYVSAVTDADVVVVAGDIHTKARGVRWALDSFSGTVLYVPSNHEFYSGHLTYTLVTMRSAARDGHVQVMNMHEAEIGGIRFSRMHDVDGLCGHQKRASGRFVCAYVHERFSVHPHRVVPADRTERFGAGVD